MNDDKQVISDADVEAAQAKFEESKAKLIDTMNELEEKGKLYMLKEEEIQLLKAFKTFKVNLTKPKVFTWMTRPYAVGEE